MNPLIIISSQSLACGCLLADAVTRSRAEKEAPHLVIGEATPPQTYFWLKLELERQRSIRLDPRLKENHYERAYPNQPWFARFRKGRRR